MRCALCALVLLTSATSLANGQRSGELFSLPHDGQCKNVAFSADGKLLAVAVDKTNDSEPKLRKREVVIWDVKQRKEERHLPGHSHALSCVAFSPDGKLLAVNTVPKGRGITLWDLNTAQPISIVETLSYVQTLTFSPDGALLAGGLENTGPQKDGHSAKVWEVASGQEVHSARVNDRRSNAITFVDFSPKGDLLVAGTEDRDHAVVWSTKTWKETAVLQLREGPQHLPHFRGVKFFPDGMRLAIGQEQRVAIWDIAKSKRIAWAAPREPANDDDMALSRDGTLVARAASRGDTGLVWVWRTATSQQIQLYQCSSVCRHLAFSPDGKLLAGGLYSGTVLVWDVTRPSRSGGKR